MRIFSNNEIKNPNDILTNISRDKETSDKINKYKKQIPNLDMENESKRKADLIEISEDARNLYEEMERLKENAETSGKAMEDLGKILEIARRISNGDSVPSTDEKKLMEYSSELYQAAKLAALLKENKNQKEHDSLFDDEDIKKKVNKEEMVTATNVISNIDSSIEPAEVSIKVELN